MTKVIRLLADRAHFLENSFFDLTDAHSCQAVDLSNLLKRMRSLLRSSNENTVMTFRMIDPLFALLTLAVNAKLCLHCKARRTFDNLMMFVISLDDLKSPFALLHVAT